VTYDEFNNFCRSLPATSYVVQWGGAHVWKVGEKVFAIGGWGPSNEPAFSFKTSANNFEILKDMPGFRPAPYLASRGMKWIQQYPAPEVSDDDAKGHIKYSHHLVASGLSKKKQRELGVVF
jgi:predicted DNA-binding protein (MmcQ/YjbR family)